MMLQGIFIIIGMILLLVSPLIDNIIISAISLGFGLLFFLGGLIAVSNDNSYKAERKYPASEYRLDYEIITRGEQVDTVYVLTKKSSYDKS